MKDIVDSVLSPHMKQAKDGMVNITANDYIQENCGKYPMSLIFGAKRSRCALHSRQYAEYDVVNLVGECSAGSPRAAPHGGPML